MQGLFSNGILAKRSRILQAGPRRITILGGAGYIGNILVRRLLDDGRKVTILDRLDFGDAAIRPYLDNPDCTLIQGDFRDVGLLVRSLRDADAVVHLGAIVGDRACALDESETIDVNYRAVDTLSRVAAGLGVPRLVFASTCSVYGASPEIVDEQSRLNPVSLYATTKIDAENLLLSRREPDFHPVILRLGTAFGWSRRPRFDLVVNLLAAKAHFENKAVIYNGKQWRPFVHVEDLARAFEVALFAPLRAVSGEIFNVGDDRMNHRLDEVGDALKSLRSSAEVIRESTPDVRDYRVSFNKIRSRLGFRAKVTLLDGMREISNALEQGAVDDYLSPAYHNHRASELTAVAAG
jgi:nucleoside-diphosphate-sugar epimerase